MIAPMTLIYLAYSTAVRAHQLPALPVVAAFRTEFQVGIQIVADPVPRLVSGARQRPCQTADHRRPAGKAAAIRANGGCHEI